MGAWACLLVAINVVLMYSDLLSCTKSNVDHIWLYLSMLSSFLLIYVVLFHLKFKTLIHSLCLYVHFIVPKNRSFLISSHVIAKASADVIIIIYVSLHLEVARRSQDVHATATSSGRSRVVVSPRIIRFAEDVRRRDS